MAHELDVGGAQVLVLALVFPGEEAALPDIREAVPPPALETRFSKAYEVPVGSASWGVGSPSIRHRSMKWDWDDAFSVVVTPRHFCANACGVSSASVVKLPYPAWHWRSLSEPTWSPGS
jgi:hypothetical protein